MKKKDTKITGKIKYSKLAERWNKKQKTIRNERKDEKERK